MYVPEDPCKRDPRLLALTGVLAGVQQHRVTAAGEDITEPRTLFAYQSEPGDYIGQGMSNQYTTDNATISMRGTAQYLTFSVFTTGEFWFINLAAPSGEILHPGVYFRAERAPFRTGR